MKKFILPKIEAPTFDEEIITPAIALGTPPRFTSVKEGVLTRLDAAFPEKELLTLSDVSRFTGKSRYWCRKHLPFAKGGDVLTKNALAELLC